MLPSAGVYLLLGSILCFLKSDATETLPPGNYLSGAYAANIGSVIKLISSIVQNEEKFPVSQQTMFLSQAALTATDIPVDAEGSGSSLETRAYIPLTEFRRIAASYLERVAKHQTAVETKAEFKERLRDLRTEKILRKYAMAKHLESLEGFPVMNEYNNFVEKKEIIEKRVIEFFTLRSQRTSSIYDDLETTANEMIKKIHTFLEPKNLLDAVLALNKYSDKVFINLYHTFRNHLIFLTVSMTTNVLSEDPAALNNVTFFKEHRDGVEIEYLSGIQSLKMANARRDQEGFTFDNLFTDAQIKSISRYSNLPQSELQNLFVFNGTTEDFEPKYTFVTIRNCNTETSHLEVFNGFTAFKATNVNNCNVFVIRQSLEFVPEENTNGPKKLQTSAITALKKNYSFEDKTAIKAVGNLSGTGFFALAVQLNAGSITDSMYHDPRTYNVVLDLAATREYKERYGYYNEYHTKTAVTSVQFIGYFLKPLNANY